MVYTDCLDLKPPFFEKSRDAIACESAGLLPADTFDLDNLRLRLRIPRIMTWWCSLLGMLTAMLNMLLDVAQFWREVSDPRKWAGGTGKPLPGPNLRIESQAHAL